MEKVFSSFAVGQVVNVTRTPNNTYIINSDEGNYKCEVVEGDEVCIINFKGYMTTDIIDSIDIENNIITFEKCGIQDFYSLIFIGV